MDDADLRPLIIETNDDDEMNDDDAIPTVNAPIDENLPSDDESQIAPEDESQIPPIQPQTSNSGPENPVTVQRHSTRIRVPSRRALEHTETQILEERNRNARKPRL
jgi:hypothetical protein